MMRTTIVFLLLVGLAGLTTAVVAQEPPQGPQGGPGGGPGGPPGRMGPPQGGDFFARHDANKDGKVTLDELCAPMKKLLADLDKDQDGAISHEEFEAGKPQAGERRGRGQGEGRRPDGPPGAEGRRGAGGPGGNGGGGRPSAEERFKSLDTDGNGVLSLEEFKAGAEQRGRRGRGGGRR